MKSGIMGYAVAQGIELRHMIRAAAYEHDPSTADSLFISLVFLAPLAYFALTDTSVMDHDHHAMGGDDGGADVVTWNAAPVRMAHRMRDVPSC